MTRGRGGAGLVEALMVLLLLALVLQLAWSIGAGVGRSAAVLAERAEGIAASRAAAWILQEELAGVLAPRDLAAPAGDSFPLRAFRGWAVVCGEAAPAELLVRWQGVRAPDPAKDSLLALGPDGSWSARALVARSAAAPPACGAGVRTERWTVEAPPGGVLLLRFFERGSYHLGGEELRYRIGAGGRQPLTPPAFDPDASGLSAGPPAQLLLELRLRGQRPAGPGPALRRAFLLPGRW